MSARIRLEVHTESVPKAVFKVVSLLVVSVAAGSVLISIGWSWRVGGQLIVHPKNGAEYVAYPTGPTALAFRLRVWSVLAVGSVLLVAGLSLAFQLCAKRYRRQLLHRIRGQKLRRNGTSVPVWFVVVVLLSLFGFIVVMALKRHL